MAENMSECKIVYLYLGCKKINAKGEVEYDRINYNVLGMIAEYCCWYVCYVLRVSRDGSQSGDVRVGYILEVYGPKKNVEEVAKKAIELGAQPIEKPKWFLEPVDGCPGTFDDYRPCVCDEVCDDP